MNIHKQKEEGVGLRLTVYQSISLSDPLFIEDSRLCQDTGEYGKKILLSSFPFSFKPSFSSEPIC